MKAKDFILASLVTLNLFLLVSVVAVAISQSEPEARATGVESAGYYRLSTMMVNDDREGLAIVDTVTNKLKFYVKAPGRKNFEQSGDAVDLSKAFGH